MNPQSWINGIPSVGPVGLLNTCITIAIYIGVLAIVYRIIIAVTSVCSCFKSVTDCLTRCIPEKKEKDTKTPKKEKKSRPRDEEDDEGVYV